jgi:PAS domain S-box-containing protein
MDLGIGTSHSAAPSVAPLINSAGLQLIYKTAPIGLAFLSPDCRYVMINEHLTDICGLSVADHIGRSVRETVPQVAEQVEQLVGTIVCTGEPITGVEVHGQRPDGSNKDRVWITYWHPLKNRSGKVIGINVAAKEVTERKRAEATIAASEERLRSLNAALAERVEAQAQERDRVWNVSQDLLVVSDATGSIVSVNPAWLATLGWPTDELIGKSGEWLIHPDDLGRSRTALDGLVAGRTTRHFENRLRHKDGTYRWLSWFAVPDRGVIYASGRDITSLRKAQDQLHKLRRELEHDSRRTSMGEMTASIAHEIRQPLAAIVTNANAGLRWLNRPNPDIFEVQTALSQIAKAGTRMAEVIESIRSMFGQASAQKGLVDVRLLVNEVLELCQDELETHGIKLRSEMHGRLPKVMAAHMQLQQVFLNLITNAIEAMSATMGQDRRLTISAKRQGQANVLIAIEDTGPGIDAAHIARIFEPFFTTKSYGMGMGLAICRSIIEAHGGKLTASPRRPFGTTFVIALPPPASNKEETVGRGSAGPFGSLR